MIESFHQTDGSLFNLFVLSQHPTLPIYGSHFTIGHGAHHDLRLGESSTASPVCRLKQAKVL